MLSSFREREAAWTRSRSLDATELPDQDFDVLARRRVFSAAMGTRPTQEIKMRSSMFALVVLCVFATAPVVFADGETPQRIRPLEIEEWSPETLEKLTGIGQVRLTEGAGPGEDGRKPFPGMLKTVAHHPEIMDPFLDFATAISHRGSLSRRDSELLALRVAWNCQSEFEWGHHVDYARSAGLTKDEIARIPLGSSAKGWSAKERTLLDAADQLHARQQITDETWSKLAAEYSDKQLVELLFVVGEYTMLSMVVNASGVELEEGFERLPTILQGK